jgi:hypothetical protein
MNLTPHGFYYVYHLSARLLIPKIQFKLDIEVTVIMTKLDYDYKYHNETIGDDNYNTIMISIYTSVYSISQNSTHRSQNIPILDLTTYQPNEENYFFTVNGMFYSEV